MGAVLPVIAPIIGSVASAVLAPKPPKAPDPLPPPPAPTLPDTEDVDATAGDRDAARIRAIKRRQQSGTQSGLDDEDVASQTVSKTLLGK